MALKTTGTPAFRGQTGRHVLEREINCDRLTDPTSNVAEDRDFIQDGILRRTQHGGVGAHKFPTRVAVRLGLEVSRFGHRRGRTLGRRARMLFGFHSLDRAQDMMLTE